MDNSEKKLESVTETDIDDNEEIIFNKSKSKHFTVFDSDSDTESKNINNLRNQHKENAKILNENNNNSESRRIKEAETHIINQKGELQLENNFYQYKSSLKGLVDSESSEDEKETPSPSSSLQIKPKLPLKKTKKQKQLNAKDAGQLRREIRSESSRMLRETHISLPYHRPKHHKLKDFLNKHTKLTPNNNYGKISAALAIKMPTEQLKIFSDSIEKSIREVKEFFKSDDESDEDSTSIIKNDIKSWLDNVLENCFQIVEKSSETEKINEMKRVKETSEEAMEIQFPQIQPTLKGNPDDIIDLEDGNVKKCGIGELIERLAKHTKTVKKTHYTTNLNIINVSQGEIHNETIPIKIGDKYNENYVKLETPGAGLQKFKKHLENIMAHKRSILWQQKQNNKKLNSNKCNEAKEDYEDDYLDDEKEELLESSEDDYYDEELDEYLRATEKPSKKSVFLDNEALDEDNFDSHSLDYSTINDEDNDNSEINEEQMQKNDKSSFKNDINFEQNRIKKSRILKAFVNEDSDEEKNVDSFYDTENILIKNKGENINNEELKKSNSENVFLTPINNMTGLKNLIEIRQKEDLFNSPFKIPISLPSNEEKNIETETPTTQDLLNICSGQFSGISLDQTSENSPKELTIDDEDKEFISQLIDEDEIMKFKKKFESPIKETAPTGIIESDDEDNLTELANIKRKKIKKITDSDNEDNENEEEIEKEEKEEEEDDDEDDDDDEEEEEEEEEVIKLRDSDIEYDSEENEILSKQIDIENEKKIRREFFEEEAELSESDWDSADEDERDLDKLDIELGDNEKFDEDKLRTDIERVQLRQMLDEDNRDVKILQEILLEDGELHGKGRQRQFRWKNIDSVNDDNEENKNNDDIYLDEEDENQNELEWRKQRHQREIFLMKKSQDANDDTLSILDSKILRIGKKLINNQATTSKQIFNNNNPQAKRGSFLARSDQVLQKLAEFTKTQKTSTISSLALNSKNVTIQKFKETTLMNANKRKSDNKTSSKVKRLRLDVNITL